LRARPHAASSSLPSTSVQIYPVWRAPPRPRDPGRAPRARGGSTADQEGATARRAFMFSLVKPLTTGSRPYPSSPRGEKGGRARGARGGSHAGFRRFRLRNLRTASVAALATAPSSTPFERGRTGTRARARPPPGQRPTSALGSRPGGGQPILGYGSKMTAARSSCTLGVLGGGRGMAEPPPHLARPVLPELSPKKTGAPPRKQAHRPCVRVSESGSNGL